MTTTVTYAGFAAREALGVSPAYERLSYAVSREHEILALLAAHAATPRVLGVDDFVLRRGQVRGTVLIDCESSKPAQSVDPFDAAT